MLSGPKVGPVQVIMPSPAGHYVVDLGEAILPNGILSKATATLAHHTRSDVLVPDGIHLEVIGEDGKPLVNAYEHGWRAGTEQVHVHLGFSVESFEPRTTLTITGVVLR